MKLDLDTPSSTAHIAEHDNQVMVHQGSYVSRITYDSIEVMSLETFKNDLLKQQENDSKVPDLVIMRDLNNKTIALINGSEVVKYNLLSVEDCSVADVCKHLKKDDSIKLFPGVQWPLVGYVTAGGYTTITAHVPSLKVPFRNGLFSGGFEPEIYVPPVWFSVKLNSANSICSMGMVVVLDTELDVKKTTLLQWPLPNVFRAGAICTGGTYIKPTDMPKGVSGLGMYLHYAHAQIFQSSWNTDLVRADGISNLDDVYEALPRIDAFARRLERTERGCSREYLLKVLRVLSEPAGYRKLNYRTMPINAETFLEGNYS